VRFNRVVLAFVAAIVLLAACSSPEERAAAHLVQAQKYFDDGNYVKAGIEAKNAAQIEPKDADARYLLALIAEQEKQYRAVFGHLMVAVDADPEHIEAQIKLGTVYFLAEVFDLAEEQARIAMELAPDNVAARVLNARVLAQNGEREAAIAEIEAALSMDPENLEAILLEVAAYALTDREKSFSILDAAVERLGPEKNKALRQVRLMMLAQDNRLDDLEAEYRGLLKDFPAEESFRYELAGLLISQDRIADAEQLLRDVVVQDPENIKTRLELAQFLDDLRSPEAAREALKGFIDELPDALELRMALALHYDENEMRDDALREYTEIARQAPVSDQGFLARNRIAAIRIQEDEVAEGRAMIDAILVDAPANMEALLGRAMLNSFDGNYKDALADLRVVLRTDPESQAGLLAMARAHYYDGDPVLARDAYRRLLELEPAHAEATDELAALLSASGELADAEGLLRERLEADPADVPAANRLVELLLEQGRLDAAEQEARRMVAASEDNWRSHFALGRVLQAVQRYRDAADAYQNGHAKEPLADLALEGMVRAMIAGDEVDEAIDYLQAHLQTYPEHISAKFLLGTLFARTGDYERAIALYEEVLEETEPSTTVYSALAMAYPTDPEARIKVYERARDEIPGDPTLGPFLGDDYERVGRYEDAIALYTEMLAANPELHSVANDLAVLLLDYRTDEESFRQALQLASRFSRASIPAALDTLGWAYYRNGNYEQAVTFLERAVMGADQAPELRYHLGMAYLALDNPVGARQELDRAISQAQAAEIGFTGIEDAQAALKTLEES